MTNSSMLLNCGNVTCLKCGTVLRYGDDCSDGPIMCRDGLKDRREQMTICRCGNIEIKDKWCLLDYDGSHCYNVVPDFFKNECRRTIVVDLDDTLAKNIFPFIGNKNLDLIERLKEAIAVGYRIVVYTCRLNPLVSGGPTEVRWHRRRLRQWLDSSGLEEAEICTDVKPYGVLSIDDRAGRPSELFLIDNLIKCNNNERFRHS